MGKFLFPLLLLGMLLGLAAWWDRPLPRADLTIVNNGEVSTLDYTQMSWMQDFRAARLIGEGLTKNDVFSRAYGTVPAVAARWEISEDGKRYTFYLRPEAKWSNGERVTAEHFRYAWMRMLLPENGADYAKLFRAISGADAFYKDRVEMLRSLRGTQGRGAESWKQTRALFDATVGIYAPDEGTLVVELTKPVPYFLNLTAFAPFFPVYKPNVEAHMRIDPDSGIVKTDSAWCKPPALVCNGPFVITSWRFKREMRFERNSQYWNVADLAIDSISIPTIEDGNAAVLAFRTGSVDWVSDVVPPYRADMLAEKRAFYDEHRELVNEMERQGLDAIEIDRRLPADERKNIHRFPAFGTYFYSFNCRERLMDGRPNPFADARVRRAFAMSVDKRGVTDQVRRSGEPEAKTLIPPESIGGYESPVGLGFDPVTARALLAEAGYGVDKPFPTVELMFNKDGGHDLIAQFIAKGWEQHLGVSVRLDQKEVKVFRELVKGGNFMVARGTWFGDYGDPTTFLDISREGDGNNDRAYSGEEFESLMMRAENELDVEARLRILSQAERIIVEDDVPLVPIFHYVQINLFDTGKMTGITPHPRQEQHLYMVDKFGDGKGTDKPKQMRE